MPLVLPGIVVDPVPLSPDEQLLTTRVTDFRFDLLERRFTSNGKPLPDVVVGELHDVTGGSVSWTYNASIKGAGSLNVIQRDHVNWLTARIMPVAIMNDEREIPLGVFIPAAPKEEHESTHTSLPIELLDKNSLLEDIYADPVTGMALSFSLDTGSDIMAAIISLIEGVGESASRIPTDLSILTANPMTWDLGTTRLKIINDLLSAANYMSLWCDGTGEYRVSAYVDPLLRPARFEMLAPFEDGRLMSPNWTRDHDIYSIPNRFVAVTTGDKENAGLISTAMLDPSSPYSYANRGRWITAVETNVEAVNQASLDRYAAWRLSLAVSVSQHITVSHPIIPDLRVNENVFFAAGEISRTLCTVYRTTVPFDPAGMCSTELAEAVAVIEDPVMDKPVEPDPEEEP